MSQPLLVKDIVLVKLVKINLNKIDVYNDYHKAGITMISVWGSITQVVHKLIALCVQVHFL